MKNICDWNNCFKIGEYKAPIEKDNSKNYRLLCLEHIKELDKRLSSQKGIKVEFQSIHDANHFFAKSEDHLITALNKYIKKETTLF